MSVRPDPRRSECEKGSLFIELAAALCVVLAGVVLLHGISLMIANSVELNETIALAKHLGQEQLKEIELAGYEANPATLRSEKLDALLKEFPNFRQHIEVQEDVPERPFRTVLVTVAWPRGLRDQRQITLSTVLAPSD